MTSTYRNRGISEQVEAVHSGSVTALDLVAAARTDIRRYENKLHAWVTLAPFGDDAGAESGGPLDGVSVGVKDIIDVRGLPTRSGSPVTPSDPASADAAVVAQLRSLGAAIQGKTVTTEFGYFSPGPTVNPWDHSHTPGGSSSGSAAAVGANTISVALGTQTAGSLTRPASYCGVAGMVLAVGSVPMDGVHGLSETLDSVGLLTRNTADLDYVHAALTGRSYDPSPQPAIAGTKLHIWGGSDLLPMAPQMIELLRELPRLADAIGVEHDELDFNDHVVTLADDHRTVMGFEAADTLAPVRAEHESELSPQLQELLRTGAEVEEREYRGALIRRDSSRRALERLLGPTGVIIGPGAQGPAPERSAGTGSPDLSRPWQLLGLPVVAVPGARTTTGMPLGLQLVGLPGSEPRLLALGRRLEKLLRRLPSFSENMTNPTLKDLTW